MSYLLGIDVGTTRTAAAIGRQGARPGETEIVNLGDRASAVPSVLYVDDDGTVIVGEAAERRAVSYPDHVVREFKRRIGDPTPILVAGRPWAPEELSARLVRWVVDRVAQREGGPAARIAITHPASWGAHKKDRLGGALAAQGLPVTFLAEPQAAAMHYAAAERVEPGSTIAVYDFGGGTFDAAVVHKDDHSFSLLGRPEGVDRLGGVDFDEVVFEHVLQGLPEAFEGLDESDPAVLSAVAAIRRECVEAKEALSSDTEVSIPVLTPAAQGSVRLHRSEFEAMIRPQVEETVDALRRAISSAGLTPAQLSAVLLVGGSSRIPLVGQLVSEQLSRPVAVDADPKNAIAMGAALSLLPPPPTASGPHVPAPRYGEARFPINASAAPPGAPPMSGAGGPQFGTGQYGAAGPSASGTYRPGTGAYAAHAGAGAPPPPRTSISGPTGSRPPARPPVSFPERPDSGGDGPEFEYAPDRYARSRSGRSPAWLVSVGGAAAAAAVIAAAFLWPSGSPAPTGAGTQAPVPPVQEVTEPSPTPSEEAPPPQHEQQQQTRERPEPTPEPTQPAETPPPAPVTTAPPVTTTTEPPPVTKTSERPPDKTPPPKTPSVSKTPEAPSSAAETTTVAPPATRDVPQAGAGTPDEPNSSL